MSYEIDFIGVNDETAKKDADAICLRWRDGATYKIGVVDGGFEAHGIEMISHLNKYYFNDPQGMMRAINKTIDFLVITHPDQDHTAGIKVILENFSVKTIYMNRPWKYTKELYEFINDDRITYNSLMERLRSRYKTIAEIEDIANAKNIEIKDALQGTIIEDKILVLSPDIGFYLKCLIESEKTPLASDSNEHFGQKMIRKTREYLLTLFETWTNENRRENVVTNPENETSVVMRGIIDNSGFLLVGDAGIQGLNKAMDYMESIGEHIQDLISFYQIPHHGGRNNISSSVLDRMLGKISVEGGGKTYRSAIASVAMGSDHPLKMVTNAYIRRGVKTFKTDGNTFCHCEGDMPKRGWSNSKEIEFNNYVESWDEKTF